MPYAETKHSSDRMHDGHPLECRSRDRGGHIVDGGIGVSVPALMRMEDSVNVCQAGPDTTRSISTRPYSLVNALRERALVSIARREVDMSAFRCARTSRPPTFGSSAMPNPVPAAISATLPPASARPSRTTSISSDVSTGTDHASASRSLSRRARGMATSRRSALRSTIHGTFVRCARRLNGPATPNTAASMSWGAVEVSRRKCKDTAPSRESRACGATDLDGFRPRTVRAKGQGRFSFRRRRPRAAWLLIRPRILDFYPPLLHLSRLRSRGIQASYGERAVARLAAQRRGHHDPPAAGHPARQSGRRIHRELSSLGRKEAQALVIRLGGSAADEVTAKTTLVVIGAEGGASVEKSQSRGKRKTSACG